MFGIIADGTYRTESIGFSTPELTTGYVVATRPIKREADIPNEGTLFGRWTDEATGEVFWDEVEIFQDVVEALLIAANRGERAIWDLGEKVEIRVETRPSKWARIYTGAAEVSTPAGWMAF